MVPSVIRVTFWGAALAILALACTKPQNESGESENATTSAGAGGDATIGPSGSGGTAGTLTPSATAGSGGEAGGVAACRDPALTARYDECTASPTETSCDEAGGSWRLWPGVEGEPHYFCDCPTGDLGCPCRNSSECADLCVVPNDASSADALACQTATEGECGIFTGGCVCEFRGPEFGGALLCE